MFWLPMCSANLPKLAIDLHCKQHVERGRKPPFFMMNVLGVWAFPSCLMCSDFPQSGHSEPFSPSRKLTGTLPLFSNECNIYEPRRI